MSGETSVLLILSIVLLAGAVAKTIGDRYKLPSIIFLLISGIILGPSGLNVVTEDVFGNSLTSIVGFAVAIIVFEGAFHLKISRIKRSGSSSIRLITIGAIIAFLGTAGSIYLVMDVGVEISLLIAALLVATGPTVITPIMEVVEVRPSVETAMETEGIANDVTAAILSVVIFEAIVISDEAGLTEFLIKFAERVAVGVGIGIIGAFILYQLAKIIAGQDNSVQDIEILVLVGAVTMFAGANSIVTESGVAAVAVSGIILGNIEFPFREEVGRFADNVTPIVLSVVFIILAALVKIETIVDIFWYEGLIVLILIIFVIRPLLVFISCYKGLFTFKEKVFISFVGPRGIIPASVASLFAIDLRDAGMGTEADILVSTVFLVIFATVFIEAGPARYIAEKLEIKPMKVIIVGGSETGKKLAERLSENRQETVTIIDKEKEVVENLRDEGFSAIHGDGTDIDVLEEAGIEDTKILAAVTGNDDTNLLSVKISESQYGVKNVYAKVNQEQNKEAFENIGINTVSESEATAIEVDNLIERPVVTNWMDDLRDNGDISDIVIENEDLDGIKLSEFKQKLPKNSLIVLVKRESEVIIPDGETKISQGDSVTFVAEEGRIHDIRFICQQEN
jgi:NhaP-type Na+/H+ or K+/H+ antiporter